MPIDPSDFDAAIAAVADAQTIALACHVNPDGDALGSLLGLGLALEGRYPEKRLTFLSHDGVPEIYQFLPGHERILCTPDASGYDLAIALDSGDLARVGEGVLPIFAESKKRMDIDHHVGDGAFGEVRLLDSRAAATAEIIFDLVHAFGIPITQDIATCLLTGVITDTGSFRFMNVTPNTLRTAANLIEAGASPAVIAERVFDNRPFAGTKLMGLALSTLSATADGRVTWARVAHEDFAATGATDEDTEGFIASVRAVRGTEVALLFREVAPGRVRISLRSIDGRDVSKIANQFGGGGHRMAAGCSFTGSLADAQTALLAAVQASL